MLETIKNIHDFILVDELASEKNFRLVFKSTKMYLPNLEFIRDDCGCADDS